MRRNHSAEIQQTGKVVGPVARGTEASDQSAIGSGNGTPISKRSRAGRHARSRARAVR